MIAPTLRQPFPLPSSPLVNPQTGIVTDPWLALLNALYRRTGTGSGVDSAAVQSGLAAEISRAMAAEAAIGRLIMQAGAAISGHRALMVLPAGGVAHADPSLAGFEFVGISTGAAAAGAQVQVVESGVITEPSWAWTPALPIYVAPSGNLTQTPPSSGTLQQVAVALSATAILVQPFIPFIRN